MGVRPPSVRALLDARTTLTSVSPDNRRPCCSTLTGDATGAAGTCTGVVWDSRNNSVAYALDFNLIRIIDFGNPSNSNAVSTLQIPNFPDFSGTNIIYGTGPGNNQVYTASMCGDRLQPQTLYLTMNLNTRYGLILAIKLDFINGITVTRFSTDNGPASCAVDRSGRYVYYADGSYIRQLDTLSPTNAPLVPVVGGGLAGDCDCDGPATGAGFISFSDVSFLTLDPSDTKIYLCVGPIYCGLHPVVLAPVLHAANSPVSPV